jgi:multimeric flavodoxin WrbA
MKVLAIQASPGENGLTASMAKAAMEGAQAAGAEVELIHACQLQLESCRQCEADGWGQCRRIGECVIEDDMAALRAKMAEADAIILASPVYWGDLAEVLKSFLDRLRRCERAGPKEPRVEGRWMLSIAAAGGGGGGGPTCLVSMERYYATLGLRPFDQLIVTRRSREYMLEAARRSGAAFVPYVQEQTKG